jgi:hypothetical protein
VSVVAAYGLSIDVPPGWDARVYRRPATPPESTHPVLHAGNFPLPGDRGDYGSGAVERMGAGNVFLALLEFHPSATDSALFSRSGRPSTLDPSAFSPGSLQRSLPGQAGTQAFFSDHGRAFCLYVVLGSWTDRARLVPPATDALRRVAIGAAPAGDT